MYEFLIFLLCFAALILLTLTSVSTPILNEFYFLHAEQAGGVRFGVWGWCLDSLESCSARTVGYDWEPEIITWLTRALVMYPIAAGLTAVTLISAVPSLCSRYRDRLFPTPTFIVLVFLSFLTSIIALAFTLALFIVGMRRFRDGGFDAELGPCIWMSVAAAACLIISTMGTGCGCGARGRFSRASPYLAYNV